MHIEFFHNWYVDETSYIYKLLIKLAEKDLLQCLTVTKMECTKQIVEALASFNKLEILRIVSPFNLLDEMLLQLTTKENIKELHLLECRSITGFGNRFC